MEEWVGGLQSIGMNTVEVTAYAKQGAWNSDDLTFQPPSSTTIEEIRVAKRKGMKVVLILRMKLDETLPENDFIWHGMIFPESEEDLKSWFLKYLNFSSTWARVAEEEGVDLFVIGSELTTLFSTVKVSQMPGLENYFLDREIQANYRKKVLDRSTHLPPGALESFAMPRYGNFEACLEAEGKKKAEWANVTTFYGEKDRLKAVNRRRALANQYWMGLIRYTRTLYTGKLSLAANFDNYPDIRFWHTLDCLSINAYFPLRTLHTSGEEHILNSWREVLFNILQFRKQAGIEDRPVFFTELGYTEYAGSTICPWEGKGFSLVQETEKDSLILWKLQQPDVSERQLAVNALVRAIKESDFPIQGVLYWKFALGDFDIEQDPFAMALRSNQADPVQKSLVSLIQ